MNEGEIVYANGQITANVNDDGRPLVLAQDGERLRIVSAYPDDQYQVEPANAPGNTFYASRYQLRYS